MTEHPTAFLALLVEGPDQGPILMEVEMEGAGSADAHAMISKSRGRWSRVCVVRCEFERGNRLLFDQMCDGAARHEAIRNSKNEENF